MNVIYEAAKAAGKETRSVVKFVEREGLQSLSLPDLIDRIKNNPRIVNRIDYTKAAGVRMPPTRIKKRQRCETRAIERTSDLPPQPSRLWDQSRATNREPT